MSTPRRNKVYQERLLHEKLDKVEARERQLEEIFKMHEADKESKKEEFKKNDGKANAGTTCKDDRAYQTLTAMFRGNQMIAPIVFITWPMQLIS
jgi:hypothetical protein